MDNMKFYNQGREVPAEAIKPISGGRLSGMSDINPMWRIKKLTEMFGMCGFGWKYEIVSQNFETGANSEISCFVQINLYVKVGCEWSAAIPGIGGNSYVAKESKGMYTSDECTKMALTDALSVACKAIGIAADVYFEKDKTKYTAKPSEPEKPKFNNEIISEPQRKRIFQLANKNEALIKSIIKEYNYDSTKIILKKDYNAICNKLQEKAKMSA